MSASPGAKVRLDSSMRCCMGASEEKKVRDSDVADLSVRSCTSQSIAKNAASDIMKEMMKV
jgi:hypothetical protein